MFYAQTVQRLADYAQKLRPQLTALLEYIDLVLQNKASVNSISLIIMVQASYTMFTRSLV